MSRTGRHSMPVSSSHLLHRDLAGRVADVGPAGGVQPDAAVGPLDQQDLLVVVVDDRADGHLGRDVAGDAVAHALHPLVDEVLGVELLVGLRRGRMSPATASTSSNRSRS